MLRAVDHGLGPEAGGLGEEDKSGWGSGQQGEGSALVRGQAREWAYNPTYQSALYLPMSCNRHKIHFLRELIPSFECEPGCHDCCGPVTTSTEEMARLPRKSQAEQEAALERLDCVHLGPNGCTVYEERPMICRLFGTTPRMACPRGRGPEPMIEPAAEQLVHQFIATTRQVLV